MAGNGTVRFAVEFNGEDVDVVRLPKEDRRYNEAPDNKYDAITEAIDLIDSRVNAAASRRASLMQYMLDNGLAGDYVPPAGTSIDSEDDADEMDEEESDEE